MKPSLIGLYSPTPGCGKTTVASILSAFDYEILSFAQPIKEMTKVFLMSVGHPERVSDNLINNRKNDPILGSVTTRHLLQTLGTEWGRECIYENIWVDVWENNLNNKKFNGKYKHFVVDDVRFKNEAEKIYSLGGHLWRIERPASKRRTWHKSEGGLNDWAHFHWTITNNGSLNDLDNQVIEAIK